MGVFVTGRQVALEIDMPGWWLANASVDMDFRRGLYYDLSTANPRAATDFLSCVRASTGYAKNADGTLTSFASNALRIGSGMGLLIEDARTNTQTYSQDLTQASAWTLNNLAVGSNTTAPDGTSTAQQLTENAVNGYHRVFQVAIPTVVAGAVTGSVYFKDGSSNGRRYAGVHLIDITSGNRYSAIVDLQTGLITQTGTSSVPPSGTSSSVEVLGNGWYRLIASLTATGTSAAINIFASNSATPTLDGFGLIQYAGDNVSNFYAWGLQLESANFPSSYIPTTSAAATRAADAILCIGNLNTLINAASVAATVVMDNKGTGIEFTDAYFLGFQGVVSTLSNNKFVGLESSNGINGIQASFGSATLLGGYKGGIAGDASTRSIALNGQAVVSDAHPWIGANSQPLGNTGPLSFFLCRRLTIWNSKLADATLQALTAP